MANEHTEQAEGNIHPHLLTYELFLSITDPGFLVVSQNKIKHFLFWKTLLDINFGLFRVYYVWDKRRSWQKQSSLYHKHCWLSPRCNWFHESHVGGITYSWILDRPMKNSWKPCLPGLPDHTKVFLSEEDRRGELDDVQTVNLLGLTFRQAFGARY